MSWISASLRGLFIVAYFIVATVWLPDRVATINAVASASRPIRDIAIAVVWAGALGVGIWLLRVAQRRRLI